MSAELTERQLVFLRVRRLRAATTAHPITRVSVFGSSRCVVFVFVQPSPVQPCTDIVHIDS